MFLECGSLCSYYILKKCMGNYWILFDVFSYICEIDICIEIIYLSVYCWPSKQQGGLSRNTCISENCGKHISKALVTLYLKTCYHSTCFRQAELEGRWLAVRDSEFKPPKCWFFVTLKLQSHNSQTPSQNYSLRYLWKRHHFIANFVANTPWRILVSNPTGGISCLELYWLEVSNKTWHINERSQKDPRCRAQATRKKEESHCPTIRSCRFCSAWPALWSLI